MRTAYTSPPYPWSQSIPSTVVVQPKNKYNVKIVAIKIFIMLKKYVKNRRKCRLLCLLAMLVLIILTIVILKANPNYERIIDEGFIEAVDTKLKIEESIAVIPEKYNEHKIKTRLIKDKIKYLTQQKEAEAANDGENGNDGQKAETNSPHIHIFYSAPVVWYKKAKSRSREHILPPDGSNATMLITPKTSKVLNTSFYPALGLYQPNKRVLQKHFQNIRNCGIGVIILSLGAKLNADLIEQMLSWAPNYNLSVAFEITIPSNRSLESFKEQVKLVNGYASLSGFYRVFSIARNALVPLIYVSNAYKLSANGKAVCESQDLNDAVLIGHIRLKNHAEILRRICFDGFYTKSPSNGAVFASTWKNWSYLKSFAMTYKMLFVPTVGPGFAERNKFPRHGDIQRHRSNGRYYGVAWRTAILNHIGFISIASYNNWQDGSQIEEAIPKAGFMDYNPGSVTKYLDLTTHWVGNFLKSEKQSQNCNDFFNNTIC